MTLRILYGHRDHPGEVAAGQHPQPGVQADPDAVEVAQHLRVGVRDPRHGSRVAVVAHRQLAGRRRRHPPVGGGDRVAVRIAGGIAELGVDAVEHPVGHRVLEHLGLVVHLVPAVAELVDQERLHQPVAAHHRQRGLRPASVSVTAPYFSWSTSP